MFAKNQLRKLLEEMGTEPREVTFSYYDEDCELEGLIEYNPIHFCSFDDLPEDFHECKLWLRNGRRLEFLSFPEPHLRQIQNS